MGKKAAKPGLELAKVGAERQDKKLLIQPPATKNERARRWIVGLVFIVYALLIFEGVLRKWALPGMHSILFFIRDPFVLAVYVLAIKYKMWPRWSPIFIAGCVMAAVFILLAMAQLLMNGLSPTIIIYGWRSYFYYIPLAFIIGEQFRGRDLAKLIRYSLLACIPIAILCYKQFSAPPDDVVNESLGSSAMLVAGNIVRTSGTFTVSAAQSVFIGSMIAMLLTVWILPRKWRPLNKYELLLASFAVITSFAVSGMRSAFVQAAMVGAGACASVMIIYRNRPRIKMILILPAIALVGMLIFATVFHTSFQAIIDRQIDAQGNEGNSFFRLTSGFTGVFSELQHISLLGTGLGSCTNAGFALSNGKGFAMGEDEWSRIIVETGFLGIFYILYRCWLVFYIFRAAIVATRRSRNPAPLTFICFIGLILLNGQITLQGTINGFGWLFAGFCMAANRLGTRKAKEDGLWS
jgi:hypothetical protein